MDKVLLMIKANASVDLTELLVLLVRPIHTRDHPLIFVLDDISARVHSRNRSQDMGQTMKMASNTGKSLIFIEIKRVEDKLDDVDVCISQNEYVKAVESLDEIEAKIRGIDNKINKQKNQSGRDVADEALLLDVSKLKITNRKQDLIKNLLFDLLNNISRLSSTAVGIYFTCLII